MFDKFNKFGYQFWSEFGSVSTCLQNIVIVTWNLSMKYHLYSVSRLFSSPTRMYLRDLYAESGQTLKGSFSAVSKPNVASKHSLESSRQDLHNALESNPPMKRNGRKEEDGKTGRKGKASYGRE